MNETLLHRLQKFSKRAKLIHILLILFPTVLTSTVGILSLALYEGSKDVIFGILTIVFAIAVLIGAIITLFINNRTTALARRQTAFLANVTHELRSPLAIIKLHTQTLANARIMEEHFREHREMSVNYILDATNHLDHLISQILQWKRIATKKEIIDPKACDANTPIDSALMKFHSVHKNFDGDLTVNLMESPPQLMIDEDALSRAIYNLLDNAYKYTGNTKRITLTTQLISEGRQKRFIQYSVKDNGFGIDESELNHIFDEFYRVSDNLKGAAGIGLGLGIIKSITEAHGGMVKVTSTLGEGTEFSIMIPFAITV